MVSHMSTFFSFSLTRCTMMNQPKEQRSYPSHGPEKHNNRSGHNNEVAHLRGRKEKGPRCKKTPKPCEITFSVFAALALLRW